VSPKKLSRTFEFNVSDPSLLTKKSIDFTEFEDDIEYTDDADDPDGTGLTRSGHYIKAPMLARDAETKKLLASIRMNAPKIDLPKTKIVSRRRRAAEENPSRTEVGQSQGDHDFMSSSNSLHKNNPSGIIDAAIREAMSPRPPASPKVRDSSRSADLRPSHRASSASSHGTPEVLEHTDLQNRLSMIEEQDDRLSVVRESGEWQSVRHSSVNIMTIDDVDLGASPSRPRTSSPMGYASPRMQSRGRASGSQSPALHTSWRQAHDASHQRHAHTAPMASIPYAITASISVVTVIDF
jgi:hypothetical protein